MSISLETKKSCSHRLDTFINGDVQLVTLSIKNVARVEAMIRENSNYSDSCNPNAVPRKRRNGTIYHGSTAYWMQQLKKVLRGEKEIECKIVCDGKIEEKKNNWNDVIYEVISAIDRENSTHLNVGKGREILQVRIRMLILTGVFLEILADQNIATKASLIDYLSAPIDVENKQGTKHKRINYSFATKFCHYACYYLFEDDKLRDNFSIYDDIIGESLGAYAAYFHIGKYEKKQFKDYMLYSLIIDAIREKVSKQQNSQTISRNGFDHLLWYYHKGHPIEK